MAEKLIIQKDLENKKVKKYSNIFYKIINNHKTKKKIEKLNRLKNSKSAFDDLHNKDRVLKKPSSSNNLFKKFVLLITVLVIIAISYIGYNTYLLNKNEIKKFSVFSSVDYKKNINILILGTDVMQHKSSRTDTIIVANVNKVNKEVSLVSVPRDTRVLLNSETESKKINSVYAIKGLKGVKATVENLLNIKIDKYLKLDLTGFVKIIDIIGGVKLYIEQNMKYDDNAGNLHIDFKKGLKKLNGIDSMKYIRYRDHKKGDLGRIERQQKFIKSIFNKFFEIRTYFKIPELVNTVIKNVDTDVSFNMVLQIVNKMFTKRGCKMNFSKLPGESAYIEKISFYEANKSKINTNKILKRFRNER